MTLIILWRYTVAPDLRPQFETVYGADGDWAKLFACTSDYLGTSLLCGSDGNYVTIDSWRNEAAWDDFSRRFAIAYTALDAACDALTETEECIGIFHSDRPPEV